jgi:DNA repair/transcription protein MET18/MMS19
MIDLRVHPRVSHHLLDFFSTVAKKMGSTFVLGFISAMDGERDPRGLVAAFPLHARVAATVPSGPITEDLFEVVACYFPIDFSPVSY